MNFHISASTDIGSRKKVNQDSLFVRTIRTGELRLALAVLCDGMGGHAMGEVASATVALAFSDWMMRPSKWLSQGKVDRAAVESQWVELIYTQNLKIKAHGALKGAKTGTTATALLLCEDHYLALNVGDSRAYEIKNKAFQITRDQTLVQRELDLGNITAAQAKTHPRQNVLLQCVGIIDNVDAIFWRGETKKDAVYMLCSDGFRHLVTEDEIYKAFRPEEMESAAIMKERQKRLIDLNLSRGENDNISVITIKTC
jgi:serine/threonine protein phosphatase PrpC